jgi:hypothetical protein
VMYGVHAKVSHQRLILAMLGQGLHGARGVASAARQQTEPQPDWFLAGLTLESIALMRASVACRRGGAALDRRLGRARQLGGAVKEFDSSDRDYLVVGP